MARSSPKAKVVKSKSNPKSRPTKKRAAQRRKWARITKKYRLLKKRVLTYKRRFKKSVRRQFKLVKRKLKKFNWPVRTALQLFTTALIAGSLVFIFMHKDTSSNVSVIVNAGSASQSREAPGVVTTPGPAQADHQFSTYPNWSQDFTNQKTGKPDKKYWEINKGAPQNGNNEAEYYTDDSKNLRIENGALVIEATHQQEPGGFNYASGRIDTYGKLSFLYGRIDVTATLPSGIGTWPAIWFLPANTKYEDMSPRSDTTRFLNGGELDMVEEVGFNPNVNYGVVHTLDTNRNNPNAIGDYNQVAIPGNDQNYTVYSMLWTPSSITYEVNNNPFLTYQRQQGANYTTWPFDQPFYLIINLAMGGVWGGEDTAQFPGNGIDNSALPATMKVKSIYYYRYTGS